MLQDCEGSHLSIVLCKVILVSNFFRNYIVYIVFESIAFKISKL
jgi:hypothetical protein